MSASVSTDFLLRVAQATPEQRAVFDRFLQATLDQQEAFARILSENAETLDAKRETPRFLFRLAGSHCDVIFEGSDSYHVNNHLGARYLNYLLHHPNMVISAYDRDLQAVRGDHHV